MNTTSPTPATIDTYIAAFPKNVQALLQQLRQTIHKAAPDAVETISYRMPTFKQHGKNLVYFAGYAHHIGFYPTPGPIPAFADELAHYKHSKGAVQLPLDQPLPLDLIKRMVAFRVKHLTATA